MKLCHLLEFDGRGQLHCMLVLKKYLPGLDPGLTALEQGRSLLADSTLKALEREYGRRDATNILRHAGVISRKQVTEAEALVLVSSRRVADLPARTSDELSPLWHLDEVNARAAWAKYWTAPDAINWGTVKVGQIDTGYTPHKVFGFGTTPWVDVQAGRTMFAVGADGGPEGPGKGVDPLAMLMDGHGTRVASVICGFDPSSPIGQYAGIAPKVPLVPVRIANVVLFNHAHFKMAEALNYLVNDAKVSVINLSMGILPRLLEKDLKRAIDNTYLAGVIFVCAAGQPLSNVVSPAHGRRSIAVAGTTVGGVPWGQSAHGSSVDWGAPADHIYRAEMRSPANATYSGGGDGTSYSAAITSGAAALWLARHGGDIAANYALGWQRVEAFKAVAKAAARPMPGQQPGSFGAGILDLAALLDLPLPPASSLRQEANV
jgi:hypothetical protein